jgi:two-component system chemotaxis response regulator CheB
LDVVVKPAANVSEIERRALVGQIERALDRYQRTWREAAAQELSDTLPCSAISTLTNTKPQSGALAAAKGATLPCAGAQSTVRLPAHESAAPAPAPAPPKIRPATGLIEVVAIGVSTGGPMALHQILPKLPAELEVPILIVLHMPVGFTRTLAEDLNRRSALRVKEAEMGETVQPGVAYLAVGGQHLAVQRRDGQRVLLLTGDPPVNSCRPSVDVLFASVAEAYIPSRVLAIILTGMGTDGLAGSRLLHGGGAYTMVQNEATCVVYGMPRAVAEAGLADEVISLDQIADRIAALTQRTKGKQPASVTP